MQCNIAIFSLLLLPRSKKSLHLPLPPRSAFAPCAATAMLRAASQVARQQCRRLTSTGGGGGAKGAGFSRLDGLVIVNCGAGNPPAEGHGIGASTSIVCARLGAKVVSVSNLQLNADTVTAAIHEEGNEGAACCVDLRNPDEVERLLKFTLDKYGRVDAVINSGVHNASSNG